MTAPTPQFLRAAIKSSMTAASLVPPSRSIPPNVANVDRGEHVTITVSAPCNANAILPPWFYGGKTLTCSTTMVKE